ncbi:alpha/beta-hydrolase [Pholiota conissans]|uniref:Carboxylic ester hydrolase n=1 Tax=Pholiota conissans TaxID=109636 RepID=A0A9P6CUU7_9AGAR|nr:alpha/beta-hydrolase [Pholiota conissans]
MKIYFIKELVALSLCVISASAVPATTAPDATSASPTVNLGYATYQGILVKDTVTNQTNTNFLGVRYAAPPTGAARFRAARPPAFTAGVQVAGAQPAGCLAAGEGSAPTTPFRAGATSLNLNINVKGSTGQVATATDPEDCLFLNVFVPGTLGSKKNLPVVFWIHGGGYVAGSAAQFTGNDILRESGGGVILVVIQYRLGLFGFLPGQKVKQGGVLNAGLLDQQFALQWVQEHITKFGGDPTKVTIWGESAGAGSVMQQVMANGGRTSPPLFRAAMTSSTFLPSQYAFNDRIPELLFSEVVAQTNCTSAKDSLECLRSVDVNTLQAANTEINASGFFGTFVFVPVIDGTFITESPTKLLQQGKINSKFLLSVTNAFEGTSFVNQNTANTVQVPDYISQLFPNIGPAAIEAATALYAGLGTNIFQVNAIMGETIFICPTLLIMRAFGNNAFKGEFAIPPGTHGEDVGFYFPSTNAGGKPSFANPDFDNAFSEAFTDFAMSLNPNVKFDPTNITPLWKPWAGQNEMLFNKTTANQPDVRAITTAKDLIQRCAFWESVSAQTAQ